MQIKEKKKSKSGEFVAMSEKMCLQMFVLKTATDIVDVLCLRFQGQTL